MKPRLLTSQDRRDWAEFCADWPLRILESADAAFAVYATSPNSRQARAEFDELQAAADHACQQQVSPIRLGHLPAWFRRRLKRVLGPAMFRHLKTPEPWLENYGSTPMPLDVIAFNCTNSSLHQAAQQDCDVFVVEPIRPWLIGKTPEPMTEELASRLLPERRNIFRRVIDKLLAQPTALAAALRCRIQISRAAVGGWHRMRVIFVPECVQEPDYFTPESFCQRTCRCRDCIPSRARRPGVSICRCEVCSKHWK